MSEKKILNETQVFKISTPKSKYPYFLNEVDAIPAFNQNRRTQII